MSDEELKKVANEVRKGIVTGVHAAKSGHPGGSLGAADIMTYLYFEEMNVDPADPRKADRDRFVLSKGHCAPGLYAVLAERGFFPKEDLETLRHIGSHLQGHPNMNDTPGVDMSTGSLGQGISAAAGMALTAKQDGRGNRVFAVLGDGECDEGSVWEAALFANHYKLDNLVAIVDHNHMQSLDYCEKTLELEDFAAKWRAFGWNAIELDGHDHDALRSALKDTSNTAGKPTVIIANTVKGRGVSFMENDILWHYRFPHDGWEYDGAVTELHAAMPEGVTDPYTPNGIADPIKPEEGADIGNDHTTSAGWHPSYF